MESRGILLQLSNSVCLGERLAAIFGSVGVVVTDQEIIDIEKQRSESLRSHGLLEFDSSALEMLFTSLGQSSVFQIIMQLKRPVILSSCTTLFARRVLPRSAISN